MTVIFLLLFAVSEPSLADEAARLGLLLKAKYAFRQEDYQKAKDFAEQAALQNPNHADSAFLHIHILHEIQNLDLVPSEQHQEALLVQMRKYQARFPNDYRFSMLLGGYLIQWGSQIDRQREAEVFLTRAIGLMKQLPTAKNEEMASCYYDLARAHFLQSAYFDAALAFEASCLHDPNQVWAWYYAGQTCEASFQYRKALRYYKKFYENSAFAPVGGHLPVQLRIAQIEYLLQPYKAQRKRLTQALDRPSTKPAQRNRAISLFYQTGRYHDSLYFLTRIPANERNASYYQLLLPLYLKLGDYDALFAETDAAIQRESPAIQTICINYGLEAALLTQNYQRVSRYRQNFSHLSHLKIRLALFDALAHILKNNDGSVWRALLEEHGSEPIIRRLKRSVDQRGLRETVALNVVQMHMDRENWQEALSQAKKQGLRRDFPDILAMLYFHLDKPRKGFSIYERLIKAHPDRSDYLNNYGYFLTVFNGDLHKAQSLVERALALEPKNQAFLDSLGWIYFKQGKYNEAKHYLSLAIEGNEDGEKYEHLADALAALGQRESAKRFWSKALQADPSRLFQILDKLDPPS